MDFKINSMIAFFKKIKCFVSFKYNNYVWRNTHTAKEAALYIDSIKNTKKGESCVILCNGPSLNLVDFSLLDNFYCIGLNKINLLFDRSNFRPDLIVAINKYVIEQNANFFNSTDIKLFLSSSGLKYVNRRDGVNFLNTHWDLNFSKDISQVVYEGWTVTFAAMQIAYHMGFDRVALVGADHNYNQKGKPNELQIFANEDDNHFDKRYFGYGLEWQLADLVNSEKAYDIANKTYNEVGRKIYNCTEGGFLNIFDRLTLNEFLELKK